MGTWTPVVSNAVVRIGVQSADFNLKGFTKLCFQTGTHTEISYSFGTYEGKVTNS